jgi:mxaL protein
MIRARFNDPRLWLLLLSFLLVVATLFLPRVELTRKAYDVIAIVDITGSMNVRDLTRAGKPENRLDHVKERLSQFTAELPCQSKFGLGIFSERRVFILFEPVETCENFASIDASIAELNWRMAWEGDSHVTEGVHDAIANAASLNADLLFFTDGHEAPPLPYTGMPPFEGKPGEVKGLIVGVGGRSLSPIPKFDDSGREIGVYGENDVLQESRAGLPPPGAENRPGWHARNAPFGAMPHGTEHLSSVKEEHLRAIAAQAGLDYAYLDGTEALLQAFEAAARPRNVVVATDIRPYPAGLALALLFVLFGAFPLYQRARGLGSVIAPFIPRRGVRFSLKEVQP